MLCVERLGRRWKSLFRAERSAKRKAKKVDQKVDQREKRDKAAEKYVPLQAQRWNEADCDKAWEIEHPTDIIRLIHSLLLVATLYFTAFHVVVLFFFFGEKTFSIMKTQSFLEKKKLCYTHFNWQKRSALAPTTSYSV